MTRFDLAKKLAKEAGELILSINPHLGNVGKHSGKHNFLTKADLQSQKLILDGINKFFPADKTLAEETDIHLKDPLKANKLWVIDPIDGTANYERGRLPFVISIGYTEKGKTLFGVVYNPVTNELFTAEKGKGAFLNGRKINISEKQNLPESYILTSVHYFPDTIERNFLKVLKIEPMPWVEVGACAAYGICEVAVGRFELYYHERSKPWDIAAAFLIVREAGAVIKNINGEDVDFTWSDFYVLGNEKLVEEFLKIQNKK